MTDPLSAPSSTVPREISESIARVARRARRVARIALDDPTLRALARTETSAAETSTAGDIDGDIDREVDFASLDQLDASGGAWDLVLWQARDRPHGALLERVRDRLAERGRLAVLIASRDRRQLILDLSAAGLAILDDQRHGDTALLVARRAPLLIRGYAAGDEDEILGLFAPSFHVSRSLAHWRWKYLDNPYGRLRITVADSGKAPRPGFEADALVAHYAGYPVVFSERSPGAGDGRGRDSPVLQIGDTMTSPAVRRLGRGPTSVLGRCARHFYAAYCENRVAFNFGVNTGNIQRFSQRFVRAERVEPVPYRLRDARPVASSERQSARIERVHHVDGSFDRFFEAAAPHYGALVRRDQIYLRWRYLDCPDDPPFVLLRALRRRRWLGRSLAAWGVFRRHGDTLRWVDALVLPGHADAAGDLLQAALELPEHRGVERVTAWFPERPEWWHRAIEALGFEARPEPHDLALMTVPHQREDAAEVLARAYYTRGDTDLA